MCVRMCICVYMRVYAYVKISTNYHHQTKKRVDPPEGPQSKSLFDPAKKIKHSFKRLHLKSVVFLYENISK